MPVLGDGGKLVLKREAPDPMVLYPDALSIGSNSIHVRNPAYWSGDQITLAATNGLPFDLNNDGLPDNPDGYATYYGSRWFLGENRNHITSYEAKFYKPGDNADFYMCRQTSGLTNHVAYYIYRDQLDRLSFYTDRASALRGDPDRRVRLYPTDFQSLVLALRGSANYESAIVHCSDLLSDYGYSDASDEVTLASICAFAPRYERPVAGTADYDNADLRPRGEIDDPQNGTAWTVQCWLREWSLNLSAPEVDTTAVGDKFGESVKSIVTGGGTMDFLVERADHGLDTADSTQLMQLLLLTEKGSKAAAEFWMIPDRAEACGELLPGSLYYETHLLVTSTAINTRVADVIAGSLNFVTVGEIALRMGAN
jgi:hypothetical protein